MAVPMGEITRALAGVRRRLCVKWGFVDMDVYEQEYRFCYFTRCPYEKTDTTFRSIPLTTESFPQKEGGEAVWVLIIFTVSNPISSHSIEFRRCCSRTRGSGIFLPMPRCCMAFCLTAWAYLQKMVLDGYCIRLDLQDVKALVSLLRICSNNLNQYAKRANETGSIYHADIEDLQKRLEEIWTDMREVLVRLSSIQ